MMILKTSLVLEMKQINYRFKMRVLQRDIDRLQKILKSHDVNFISDNSCKEILLEIGRISDEKTWIKIKEMLHI
jgi:hypothetical protein